MPIMIRNQRQPDGVWVQGPVVICDVCEEAIERAEGAWYWFKLHEPNSHKIVDETPVFFAHKPRCNDRLEKEKQADGSFWGCEELSRFPMYLENRLAVDRESLLARPVSLRG